jgi:hypothetical protein
VKQESISRARRRATCCSTHTRTHAHNAHCAHASRQCFAESRFLFPSHVATSNGHVFLVFEASSVHARSIDDCTLTRSYDTQPVASFFVPATQRITFRIVCRSRRNANCEVTQLWPHAKCKSEQIGVVRARVVQAKTNKTRSTHTHTHTNDTHNARGL